MKKRLLLALAVVLVLGAIPASVSGSATRTYDDPPVGWNFLDPGTGPWDLTQCDLVLSFTLDVSGYTPPKWTTFWTEVGLMGPGPWGTAAQGCMASGSELAIETDPNNQDLDDHFLLMAPYRYNELTYDVDASGTVGSPLGSTHNYGIWFDRDGVDSYQAGMWGMVDGGTYNTSGVYNVAVTYHAVNPNLGTMFATINGVQQGFYTQTPYSGRPPDIYPAGKSIVGDLTSLRVYANVGPGAAEVSNLTATGCPYWTDVQIDIKPGSDPNSINLKSKGVVPVAVLTAGTFGATLVDPNTVLFASAAPLRWAFEDVDGDGDTDVLFHFRTQELSLESGEATLTGDTTDGKHVRGTDTVNIVPKDK
jgi:hypothetical protein